jgi:hypothetical protein
VSRCDALEADAAPLSPSPEVATLRRAMRRVERFSPIYDAGRLDDAAKKAEDAARADRQAQMSLIPGELNRRGFGPATLNLSTFTAATRQAQELLAAVMRR